MVKGPLILSTVVLRTRMVDPAAPSGVRGAPNPTPKCEQPGEKRTVPSTCSGCGAEKNGNANQRRLSWHFKCLQAAGVDFEFPDEG